MGRLGHNATLQMRPILRLELCDALDILAMPTIELAHWLRLEASNNPFLLIEEDPWEQEPRHVEPTPLDFSQADFGIVQEWEQDLSDSSENGDPTSLAHGLERLLEQARAQIKHEEERRCAEEILSSVDEQGFLLDGEEIAHRFPNCFARILRMVQRLDPLGVGCASVQEYWILQLEEDRQEQSIAYQIVRSDFPLLRQRRWDLLAHRWNLSSEEIQRMVCRDLGALRRAPLDGPASQAQFPSFPDLQLDGNEGDIQVTLCEELLPTLSLISLPAKEYESRALLKAAKQIIQAVEKRRWTLLRIGRYIAEHHASFLLGESRLVGACGRGRAAADLKIHPSTLSRALASKYLLTPYGEMMPLAAFFRTALAQNQRSASLIHSASGEAVKTMLMSIIATERAETPLSDQELAAQLTATGIAIARRTIAKYRQALRIPPAHLRRRTPGEDRPSKS